MRLITCTSVRAGRQVIGQNLYQGTMRLADFPRSAMQMCDYYGPRCAGFHVYALPDTTDVFIEYKSNCAVLPRESCPDLLGQQTGGRWYSWMNTVHCPYAHRLGMAEEKERKRSGTIPALIGLGGAALAVLAAAAAARRPTGEQPHVRLQEHSGPAVAERAEPGLSGAAAAGTMGNTAAADRQ